jgi:VIT1/CCC1 family predicted Fe2+/Mn2+ transporter
MPDHVHHKNIQSGWARAAVFGASDGLLTNVSLILGVAGAHVNSSFVRLAGLAGLVAGAFSMAAGEYISMSAQKELLTHELAIERYELINNPEAEEKELAQILEERGLERDLAKVAARQLMANKETALETHAREELGIDPNELGSAVKASLFSFIFFALGAFIPLVPWYFVSAFGAKIASVILGVCFSFTLGIVTSIFTRRSKIFSGLRQLAVTCLGAGVTFLIGNLIHVGLK